MQSIVNPGVIARCILTGLFPFSTIQRPNIISQCGRRDPTPKSSSTTRMSRASASEQPSQRMVQGDVIAWLMATIFILDIFFPLGFAVPVLYLLPIILTVRLVHPMAPFVTAACATGLTILGIWTSSIPSLQPGLFNRSLVILASWLAATLIWHTTQKHTRRELEILVEARTAALRQSESTLHSFFDATDLMMGVVEVVDGELVTVITNRTAAAVVGTIPNSSANHPLSELGFAPGAWDFWMPHLEKARRSGQTVHVEHQFPSRPPTVLGNRSIASAVTFIGLSAQENPLYAWIEEDITEKKQLEQRMD